MRTAFAILNERIAPVFDSACRLLIVDDSAEQEENLELTDSFPASRALRLAEAGVDVLVCGAISRQLQHFIQGYGIQVTPFVAGDLADVRTAYERGALDASTFAMPGCRYRGQGRGGNGVGCGKKVRRGGRGGRDRNPCI